MSTASSPSPGPRNVRMYQVAAVALAVIGVIVLIALFYEDLPELVHGGSRMFREVYRHNTFLAGYLLLYLEESGIPLPAPGDVFVMYVGVHVPHSLAAY